MSNENQFVFRAEDFCPHSIYELLCQLRVTDPVAVYKATQTRQPRKQLTSDGRLFILAADHPGRGDLSLPGSALGLADRYDYLARIVRVLLGGAFDGVMGTPDVLEDLCLIQQIIRENGGPAFLDGKAFIGSVNRGGVLGSAFEIDDVFTGFTVARGQHLKCDGVKVVLRVDLDAPESARALERVANLVREVNDASMALFIECAPVVRGADGARRVAMEPEAFARMASIASALGETSTRTWLRLPYFGGIEAVLRAVSLPVLIMGGPPVADPHAVFATAAAAMQAGPTVRGVMMGRQILYCGDDDPLAIAAGIEAVMRRGADPQVIVQRLGQARGARMDVLTSLLGDKKLVFEGGVQTAAYTAGTAKIGK